MDYILELEDLSKNYDNFKLDKISFKIPSGSIMGLVGENGSGKTTTIKSILNIIRRDGGSIKIFGKDNIEKDIEIKEDLGVVLDDCCFQPILNLVDVNNIMKHVYKNWDEEIFFDYARKFKLLEKQVIKEYSKGMKMKLSIAVALSHHAKLLILDEPTAGLDPIVRNEILDELLDFIQEEDHSVLFSTHITSDLDKIADYITFIHQGSLILSKDRETLLTDYGILKCGLDDLDKIDPEDIIKSKKTRFAQEILVSNRQEALEKYKDFVVDSVNIEDIMLFYIRG